MTKLKITTKTPAEITAAFDAVFKAMQPEAKPLTQADRLEPYRKQIMKQRRRGLSWRLIAQGMADPRIDEKVSYKTLMNVFGPAEKKAAAAAANAAPKAASPTQ